MKTFSFIQKQQNSESGFTLVELLVVIAIIAILTAIAVPVFLNQRKSAADAALRNDLKASATAINTWLINEPSWDTLRDLTGESSLSVYGTNHGLNESTVEWNSFNELPHIAASEGTVLGIAYRNEIGGSWTRVHEEGEFCIAGRNMKGHYAYPGGNASRYDEQLYYDVKLGGIVTVEQMVESVNAGLESSCHGFANAYKSARGL